MRILVVEDDVDLSSLIELELNAAGHEVALAPTGEAALAAIDTSRVDLVLLDLVLPGINGRDVLSAIRARRGRNDLPVIVVSGLDASQTITAALRIGANDYITKPINLDLLVARVETVLRATAASETADRRALLALRGAGVQMPTAIGHCAACEATVTAEGAFCRACGAPRPSAGWPPLAEAKAKYLGQVLDGRYFVDRLIARGGQGEVYRVIHADLERVFVAKFVNIRRERPERTEAVRNRILGEIRALAAIQSPHVVRIHDVLQLSDTIFALVMDFVGGRSVEAELNERRRLPVDEVLDIARQVAQALCEAHQLGFVHRDVKPNNIMVERLPGGTRFVRILDFGFVHTLGRDRDPNRFEGTVGYSAPEQLTGAAIDHRADIYALGVTMFDMLTGSPPYSGKPEEVVDGHVHGAIPHIIDKAGRTPELVAVDAVVQRMLAKRPADRFQDFYEVIHALDAIADRSTPRR